MILPLFHAMFINLVNSCFLNVVSSMYMIIRVEICIRSLKLEVFEENCCFTRSVLSWPAKHAICRRGGKLKTESMFFC
jgi:hypothetical protein